MKPHLDLSRNNYQRMQGMEFVKISRFLDEPSLLEELTEKQIIGSEKKQFGFSLPGESLTSENDDPLALAREKSRQRYYF